MSNIGWIVRDIDSDTKLAGGSFGGSIDMETVERLVTAHFTVKMRPSGTPVFVDQKGREVRLYLSVKPGMTKEGQRLMRLEEEKRRVNEEVMRSRLLDLLDSLSPEEAVRRLERNDA